LLVCEYLKNEYKFISFMKEIKKPMESPSFPRAKQQERVTHILDAAASLLLRWGYRRVMIEDIARQVGIGTGTIYLHFKTKEALFEVVMLRETVAVWRTCLARIQADPEEVLLHRLMSSLLVLTRQRPLARALFTRDVDLLGKLAQGSLMSGVQQMAPSEAFVTMLRDLGLLRTDMSLSVQTYAFAATVTGFSVVDSFLGDEGTPSLEEKAAAMQETIRCAFEPKELPSRAVLQEVVAPHYLQFLEGMCNACEQQIQERILS
jgi:AcrR family transcriptional regulator